MRSDDDRHDPPSGTRERADYALVAVVALLIVLIFGLAGYAYFQVR